MTTRAGPSLITGKTVAGFNTRGVLGSVILANAASGSYGAGVLNNDSLLPGAEYWVLIVSSTFPLGSFSLAEDGSGAFSAAGSMVYRLYEDGADQGTAPFTAAFDSGAMVTAVLAALESGDDVFQATAVVVGAVVASLVVLEAADDVFSGTALVSTRKRPTGHYATEADMLVRFSRTELVQLTNRDRGATALDSLVLDRALTDADAEIDARLAPRYSLPLASVPWMLTNLACDLARWRLYDDRATEQVTKRRDEALKVLEQIRKGQLSLGLDAEADQTPPVEGPTATPTQRVFSRDLLKDYGG